MLYPKAATKLLLPHLKMHNMYLQTQTAYVWCVVRCDCMSGHVFHLVLEEAVLQCFVSWVAAGTLEQQLVLLRTRVRFRLIQPSVSHQ